MNDMLVGTQTSFKSQSIFEAIISVSKNQIYTGTFFHVPISQQQKVTCSKSTIEALEKVWNMLTLKAVFSSVSIVDFEQVNVWWVLILIILVIIRLHKWCKGWKFRFDIKIAQSLVILMPQKKSIILGKFYIKRLFSDRFARRHSNHFSFLRLISKWIIWLSSVKWSFASGRKGNHSLS